MRVIFFNHFHNGDIHVSRGIIRLIIDKIKTMHNNATFYYSHRNHSGLLKDIPQLLFDASLINNIKNEHINLYQYGNDIYINTWYAQQHFKHMNNYGISFDTLYQALNENCEKQFNFKLLDIEKDIKKFFPIIDYSYYEINKATEWLNQNNTKKIFVSNGLTLSGQAHNFNLTNIIEQIAIKHPHITFILSNKENQTKASNIIYSVDIIKKSGNDLNENAFISEHCDMIIGRASGTFTFALTQNNLFNRDIKILCFSNLIPKQKGQFWLDNLFAQEVKYSSNILTTNEGDINIVQKIIEENL